MLQKQPPEVFCSKGVVRNFGKFTRKNLCQSFFFDKVAGLTLFKKRLWHRNFAKFLRTPFVDIIFKISLSLSFFFKSFKGKQVA